MHSHVFPNLDALAAELVARTVDAAAHAIAARGRFVVALTGGSAASALYPVLAQAPLPWSSIDVVFGDERCVPPAHADSNYRLAVETLLGRVAIPPERVHRVPTEEPPERAAALYGEILERVCGGVIDVVHLGMGPDGHVCSLFPGHALLDDEVRLVASLTDSPKPPSSRVTLTRAALARARELWFLVAGNTKAEAVREAILDPHATTPAARVHRAHAQSVWLLDEPAGRLLKGG